MSITLDDVKNLLIDMRSSKVELNFDEIEGVTGGGQVEIVNEIKDNKKPVTVGPVVVIGMWKCLEKNYIKKRRQV